MDVNRFKKLPVMGIIRGVQLDSIEPLIATIISSGLETIEIAMNTKNASELIRKAAVLSDNRLMIGAGTVLNLDSLKEALDAGAGFIVTPCLITEVIQFCLKNKIAVFPGAFTPGEIYVAWRAGATMVKVFPAKFFGPDYFKEIKGPFNDIELLACSGVTPQNLKSYFLNGASAIAFGSSVFKKEWLVDKNFDNVGQRIKDYLNALPKNISAA